MATVRRRSVDVDGATGARAWLVTADTGSELGDWLARLLGAGAEAGLGPFDARLRGTPEACRYALEVAGIDASPGIGAADADMRLSEVAVDSATALLDAWTEGLELVVSSAGRPDDLCLQRARTTTSAVRVAVAGRALAAALDAAPIDEREHAEPHDVSPPGSPARARHAVGAALVVGVLVVGLVAAVLSTRRAAQPAAVLPVPTATAAPTSVYDTPPVPSGAAIATDPVTGGFLVVGCCEAPREGLPRPTATWRWDGSTWEHLHPALAPLYSSGMVLGFDPSHGTFVLLGGEGSPLMWTWHRDSQDWLPATEATRPPSGPAAVAGHVTGAPPAGNSLTLVTTGGHDNLQTWSRTAQGWQLVNSSGPAAFQPFTMAADPAHGDLVLVSPIDFIQGMQTSVYDARGWTTVKTQALPFDPNLRIAWDGASQRVLAILPRDSGNVLSGAQGTAQTWAWDGAAWTEVESQGGPGGRGRLLTSWLGVVLFLRDATTDGRPDVMTWTGSVWETHPGGAAIDLRRPPADTTTLLGAHGLVLTGGPLRGDVDRGAAAAVEAHALPDPPGRRRTVSISLGTVLQGTSSAVACTCWVWEVLLIAQPACPGLELVLSQDLILIDAGSNKVASVFQDRAPPATAFSCGA